MCTCMIIIICDVFVDAACDVLCMSFSHRQPDHFLAGCSDGSLRLYHTKTGSYRLIRTKILKGHTILTLTLFSAAICIETNQHSLQTTYMYMYIVTVR